MKNYLPSLPMISRETLSVLAATLIAAYIISRFPAVQRFINANRVTGPLPPSV
jgi:hypothetical protein